MKSRYIGLLIGLLFLGGIALGNILRSDAWGSGSCGFVSIDCTTQKIPDTLIPSGAAPAYFTPANPTNLTSTSYLMFGLGSTIKITPTKSGKVRFAISYFASGVGSTGLNNYKISYGTGVAPSNGTSATGTVIGGIYSGGITALAIDAGVPTPAAVVRNAIVTGLTPSTAYWFDVQGAKKSGNTSVGMTNIEVTLEELPY